MDVCGIDATLNDIYLAESPGTTTMQIGGNCTDRTMLHIPDQAETIVVIFFFTLIGIMGIVFNIISILVVMRGKHTAKAIKGTKIQLVNQSAGDLTMALICTPRSIVRDLAFSWPDSEALCRLVPFFGQSAFESSVAWSVAISIERFVAVFFPFRIRFYRGQHKIIVAVALWTLMAISNIEYLIYKTPKLINTYSNSSVYQKSLRLCVNTVPLAQTNKPLYDVLEGLPYLIFSVIIILMYSSIGVKLWMRKRNKILRSDNKANRVEKIIKMLAADALVNLTTLTLTYIVYMSMHAADVFSRLTPQRNFIVHEVFNGIELTNSFTTPMIYFLFNQGYRNDVRSLVKRPFLKLSELICPRKPTPAKTVRRKLESQASTREL